MKRHLLLFVVAGVLFLINGCKKENCYECKPLEFEQIWVNGIDTLTIFSGDNSYIISIDATYKLIKDTPVYWQFFVTDCYGDLPYSNPDSCHIIK